MFFSKVIERIRTNVRCVSRTRATALGIYLFFALSQVVCASVFPEELYSGTTTRRGVFAEYLRDDFSSTQRDEATRESAIPCDEFVSSISNERRLFSLGYDASLVDEIGAPRDERVETSAPQGYFTGNSFYASQDVVVRGSVNLPSIKSIQFWGNGYFGDGHVSPKGWDGRVKDNNSGAAIGLNLPLGVGTLSGYYNYHRNRSKFDARNILQESDGFGLTFYANAGGFYFATLGLYGDDDYAARDVTGEFGALSLNGRQSTFSFETGYEMATLGMFVLKPFGSYQYTNVKHDAFDAQTLSRLDGKRKYNSCLMTLGSRVDLNLAGLDVFTLEGRMAWITQLRKRSESIRSINYGRVPGTTTSAQPYFQGNGAGSDLFWGGIGLRLSLLGSLAVSADYDCLVNKYQTTNETSFSLLFGF